jgi:hypothetical protein
LSPRCQGRGQECPAGRGVAGVQDDVRETAGRRLGGLPCRRSPDSGDSSRRSGSAIRGREPGPDAPARSPLLSPSRRDQLHAPVSGAALLSVIRGNRLLRTIPITGDLRGANPLRHKGVLYKQAASGCRVRDSPSTIRHPATSRLPPSGGRGPWRDARMSRAWACPRARYRRVAASRHGDRPDSGG